MIAFLAAHLPESNLDTRLDPFLAEVRRIEQGLAASRNILLSITRTSAESGTVSGSPFLVTSLDNSISPSIEQIPIPATALLYQAALTALSPV